MLVASPRGLGLERSSGAVHPQPLRETPTDREIQVLGLMAEGLTTKGIARQLGIAFKTATCHRYRILAKIGVTGTVSAVRWAIRAGLVQP
jgi:DNA-binding NarL/FixJ family response regulator